MVRTGAPRRALRSLAISLALSASLHAWVILDVEVSRPGGTVRGGSAALQATLVTSSDRAAPETPKRPEPPPPEPFAARTPEPPARPAKALPPDPRPVSPEVQPEAREAEPLPSEAASPRARTPRTNDDPPSVADEQPGALTETAGPVVQLPLLDDPEYYPARLLDVLPRPLADVVLRYPDPAAVQDISGRVVLLLLIDELGAVVEATVIEAEPPGYFEEAAIESFRDVLFQPAVRHGRAVKSRLPVEVTFDARTDSAKP